ncbi:MAG TPA: VWA domain-containing protein [Candidatus Solibacter sp.]|nr:VWA domain-containing protein [Candidatus Solibacter sp.]
MVRVGIAIVRGNAEKVSFDEARGRLIKALDQHKQDKKRPFSVQAVALDESSETKLLEEAKSKGCEFLVFTQLADVQRVNRFEMSTLQGPGDIVSLMVARVEYDVRRADGQEYSMGSAQSEGFSAASEAVLRAMDGVANEVVSDMEKGLVASQQALKAAGAAETKSGDGHNVFFLPDFCAWLPSDITHADALRGVCEYAISLPKKMPSYVCEQATSRYRGESAVPRDLVTAAVRYEAGVDSYSDVKVNGKEAPAAVSHAPGMWSSGQFGGNLRAIFNLRNSAVFKFAGAGSVGKHLAWIFSYQIARQNEPLWRLHGKDTVLAPPYGGELWVDQKTGELLRSRAVARDIPRSFDVQKAEMSTDYDRVDFADGTFFDLPLKSTVETKFEGRELTRNVIEFRNCHKFRATAHIMASLPESTDSATAAAGGTPEELRKQQIAESETLYSILREQAVREDAARLELETQQELRNAEIAVAAKWREMEKARRANIREESARSQEQARGEDGARSASAKNVPPLPKGLTTLKVGVNLVQVRVVLRDGKGHAIGGLQKEDFQLSDAGKPQVITRFSAEKGEPAAIGRDSQQGTGTEPRAKQSNAGVGPRFVAYIFDDIHSSFADLASAGQAAARHLVALGEKDNAGIFVTSGQLGINFTSDRAKLQETLKNLRPHPLMPVGRCPSISPYMADLIANQSDSEALALATADAIKCSGGLDPRLAEKIAKSTAFEVATTTSTETQSTLSILREVVRRTAIMPGSRSIVLVSPGFLTQAPETRQGIMELIDEALGHDVVFNTLDVRGLSTPTPAPNEAHSSQPVLRFRYDQEEQRSLSDVMGDLAYSTGGVYFHNNNDLNEGFRRTAETPEFLYVLGFSPQKLDGKFHKLKVTLVAKDSPKLTVQAREGYYAAKPETPKN